MKRNLEKSPETRSVFLNICFPLRVFYLWMFPFIWKSFSREITMRDIAILHPYYRSQSYLPRFKWIQRLMPKIRVFCLFLSIFLTYFFDYLVTGLLSLISIGLRVGAPLVYRNVLLGLQDPRDKNSGQFSDMKMLRQILPQDLLPTERGGGYRDGNNFRENDTSIYPWLVLLIFLEVSENLISGYQGFMLRKLEMKVKGLLNSLIFEESIRKRKTGTEELNHGKIMNFLNLDIRFISTQMGRIHLIWAPFLTSGISLYLLLKMVGVSTLIGVLGPMVVVIPLFIICGIVLLFLRLKILKLTDQRMQGMRETLVVDNRNNSFHGPVNCVRRNKMNDEQEDIGDEDLKKILSSREKDVFYQRILNTLMNVIMSVARTIPMIMIVIVIGSHYFMEGEISEITLYSSFGLFRNLSKILFLPIFFISNVAHITSFYRIDNLLLHSYFYEEEEEEIETQNAGDDFVFELNNASFSKRFDGIEASSKKSRGSKKGKTGILKREKRVQSSSFEVNDISLEMKKGSFGIITGSRGSGKTIFLNAIVEGCLGGQVSLSGKGNFSSNYCGDGGLIGLITQTPVIFSGSLKDNITMFEKEEEEEKFEEAIRICGLRELQDKMLLMNSDESNLAESSSLSHCDRLLISFARCLYHIDIVELLVIDDPFISLPYGEQEETRPIFEDLILSFVNHERSSKKSILLTLDSSKTDDLENLSLSADFIYSLDRKVITSDFEQHDDEIYNGIVITSETEDIDTSSSDSNIDSITEDSDDLEEGGELASEDQDDEDFSSTSINTCSNTSTSENSSSAEYESEESMTSSERSGSRYYIQEEERPTGGVPLKIVWAYFRNMTPCCKSIIVSLFLLVFLNALETGFKTGSQWYMTNLSSQNYFHRKYGTSFNATYYYFENGEVEGEDLDNERMKNLYYMYNSSEGCPPSKDEKVVVCEWMMVDIGLWNKSFSNGTVVKPGLTYGESLTIYASIALMSSLVTLFQGIILANLFLTSSNHFFKKIVTSIYNSSKHEQEKRNGPNMNDDASFFSKQPFGRIVSRLSRDISITDRKLGKTFDSLFGQSITGILTISIMVFTTYGTAIFPLSIVIPIYLILYFFYHKTPRELRRIQSLRRSKIFVSLDSSIRGSSTIHAFRATKKVTNYHCREFLDTRTRVEFLQIAAASWFRLYTGLLSDLLFFCVLMCSIFLVYVYGVDYAFLLLALRYSKTVSMFLGRILGSCSSLETELNALERLYFYYEKDF